MNKKVIYNLVYLSNLQLRQHNKYFHGNYSPTHTVICDKYPLKH